PARVADESDATLGGAREPIVAGHLALDLILGRVGQLQPAVVEELDAVVRRGVVRRADDRAGRELLGLREVRQARRRDVPDEAHVDAYGAEARREGALEHPAAAARVS